MIGFNTACYRNYRCPHCTKGYMETNLTCYCFCWYNWLRNYKIYFKPSGQNYTVAFKFMWSPRRTKKKEFYIPTGIQYYYHNMTYNFNTVFSIISACGIVE